MRRISKLSNFHLLGWEIPPAWIKDSEKEIPKLGFLLIDYEFKSAINTAAAISTAQSTSLTANAVVDVGATHAEDAIVDSSASTTTTDTTTTTTTDAATTSSTTTSATTTATTESSGSSSMAMNVTNPNWQARKELLSLVAAKEINIIVDVDINHHEQEQQRQQQQLNNEVSIREIKRMLHRFQHFGHNYLLSDAIKRDLDAWTKLLAPIDNFNS
jgi:hypothetical protein